MSVELISSHLIDKIKTNASEKITKSTIPTKVRETKQSSDQESRENPLDPIKNDKIIIGNRELSYFVRDVATLSLIHI